jgi:hypothetical protein
VDAGCLGACHGERVHDDLFRPVHCRAPRFYGDEIGGHGRRLVHLRHQSRGRASKFASGSSKATNSRRPSGIICRSNHLGPPQQDGEVPPQLRPPPTVAHNNTGVGRLEPEAEAPRARSLRRRQARQRALSLDQPVGVCCRSGGRPAQLQRTRGSTSRTCSLWELWAACAFIAADSPAISVTLRPLCYTNYLPTCRFDKWASWELKRLEVFEQCFLLVGTQLRPEFVTASAVARI